MSNRAAPRSLDENAVIRRLSLVSLIGNALLSAFKLLAGVWGHFGAMISDAIHSFSDVPTTFIAWFGVKVSAVPPMPPTLTLHSRMFGSKVYVDLEIEVDGSKTLQEAHAVAGRVHNELERQFPDIKHVIVHLNPAE